MKTQKISIALSILNMLAIAGAILFFLNRPEVEESAYVNVMQLYEEFDMTKELENKYTSFVSQQNGLKDSLEMVAMQIQQGVQKGAIKPNERTVQQLGSVQMQLTAIQQAHDEMKSNFEAQIWVQINTYIKDFGKHKDYKVILGATGQGSLLYAESALDITNEMSDFINARYNGKS